MNDFRAGCIVVFRDRGYEPALNPGVGVILHVSSKSTTDMYDIWWSKTGQIFEFNATFVEYYLHLISEC